MHYIQVEKNLKLAYHDFNPSSSKVIVLLHGWPFNSSIFEYQYHLLIHAGFRVIAIDQRGCGFSDTAASGYSYTQMAKDMYTLFKHLHLSRFILAGHSTGGCIALRYMTLFNGAGVQKLCLISCPAPCLTESEDHPTTVPWKTLKNYIHQITHDRPAFTADLASKLLNNLHSPHMDSWLHALMLSTSPLAVLGQALALKNENLTTDLVTIRIPTVIFHGQQDRLVPMPIARQAHQLIPGAVLYTFADSGHCPFLDNQDPFNTQFLDFLIH